MKESEDEDFTQDFVQINDTVREIFDGIFDGPMSQFKVPLESIEINEYGLVQRDGNELNTKVMSHAKTFSQAVAASFGTKHAEAAKHIEGSTCDLFLHYIYERLDESLLGQDPFNYSCEKTKKLIADKILRIKSELETKPDEQPANKSDLEVLISQTDLFDPIHIRHALLCCQVANDCDNPENSQNFLDSLEKEHLLSGLSVSYENDKVPKYVMARCGDVLYVSFKRLQTSNFGATEKSYRGEICSRIEETAKKIPLEYFAREIIQDKRIVFTGHSSGGAIASLVMISLLEKFMFRDEEYRKFHFKCITFGLMPMADVHFKRFVESIPGAEDCFFHIVQKNDIIPKLFGSCNMKSIQGKLWELVERILWPESLLPSMRISHGGEYFREVVGFKHLDIFGTYYMLDTSKTEAKYSVLSAKEAAYALTINENENLRHLLSQYLINHKLERYAHEVELAFIEDIPNLKKFYSKCNTTIADDITPKITEVQFESIGEEIVATISGSSMWFVYNVSIEGVNGDGKDLEVNVMKSLESEVQIIMRETKIVHDEQVTVRMKTHFQNSQYLPATEVVAQTTTYPVTRRQQQIANHRPREVIELAYLSALLECYDESYSSKRFDAIITFFENAVSECTETQEKRECKTTYCKSPVTLLTEGREELGKFSEEFIAEQTGHTEGTSSTTNCRMLTVLTKLRNEFETCSTLLGAFMESQISKHARSFSLSVWCLLISLLEYVKHMIVGLSKFGQFIVDFSRDSRDTDGNRRFSFEQEFPGYDENLDFLVASMKRSWVCNKNYVSYSLERQLEDQCKKRNIFHDTPVSEILAQWNANFEFENLALIQNQWRPLVARWIKLSLMINNLRESLASQTAIGVIGLVNSGKSKFVRTMFGKKTVTGTTDQKRTTVPLIYNLGEDIEGMDVIDFPGVDDRDKSIPELAELLLSLTRIIVFVVDYRRAHTESTKEWLSILEKENVPVLICLTFADKLFAKLMEEDGGCDDEKIKTGIEEHLNKTKEEIGQPESGHQRDFKLTVFALDNDSNFNTEEGKKKLRKAGLNDELDVGRWIAEKLHDYDQNEVSQNVIKFIDQKEKSTLNPCRRGRQMPTVAAEGKFDPEEQLKLDNNADADLKGKYMHSLVDNPCSGGKNHSTQGDCRAKAPIHVAEPLQDNTEYSPKITLHPENGVSSIQGIPENDDIITQSQNEVETDPCEYFEEAIQEEFLVALGVNKDALKNPKPGKSTQVMQDIGTCTSGVAGVVGGTIAFSAIPTAGISSVAGAAVLLLTFSVSKVVQHKQRKKAERVNKSHEEILDFKLKGIIIYVSKELSRMFEYQIKEMKNFTQIKTLAHCAVKLMLDLNDGDIINANTLIRKVLKDGKPKKKGLLTRNDLKWFSPSVFRKCGLLVTNVETEGTQFTYKVKPGCEGDTTKYGYRGEFLELEELNYLNKQGKRTLEEKDAKNENKSHTRGRCCSKKDCTCYRYFCESDIDSEYKNFQTENRPFYPTRILIKSPRVLNSFSKSEESSLGNFLKNKLNLKGKVHPVYRPHSTEKVPRLSNCEFTGLDFSFSDFTDSCLENCTFTDCVMLNTTLTRAKMRCSKFCRTFIYCSDLVGVDASSSEWDETNIWYSRVDNMDVRGKHGSPCWHGSNVDEAIRGRNPNNNENYPVGQHPDEPSTSQANTFSPNDRDGQYSDEPSTSQANTFRPNDQDGHCPDEPSTSQTNTFRQNDRGCQYPDEPSTSQANTFRQNDRGGHCPDEPSTSQANTFRQNDRGRQYPDEPSTSQANTFRQNDQDGHCPDEPSTSQANTFRQNDRGGHCPDEPSTSQANTFRQNDRGCQYPDEPSTSQANTFRQNDRGGHCPDEPSTSQTNAFRSNEVSSTYRDPNASSTAGRKTDFSNDNDVVEDMKKMKLYDKPPGAKNSESNNSASLIGVDQHEGSSRIHSNGCGLGRGVKNRKGKPSQSDG